MKLFKNKIFIALAAIACLLALGIWVFGMVFQDKKTPLPPETEASAKPQLHLESKAVPAFDAARTMKDVEMQMSFGPRVPNTDAHAKAVEFFKSELSKSTESVQTIPFEVPGYNYTILKLSNVLASFNPTSPVRLLILTHFDSRPWADEDPDAKSQTKPVPAANDAASGSAVMLELARQMKANPPPIGVDLLFDDGEDYGKSSQDNLDHYFLGVKNFAHNKPQDYSPRFAILLDMVGDKKAEFKMEGMSLQSSEAYTKLVWKVAHDLNLSTFKTGIGPTIEDDHLPLIQTGMQAVDIIDGDLVGHNTADPERKYWHTTDDVMKHISPDTMGEAGKLLLTLIYEQLPKYFNAQP